ncbi:hypothetical protein [Sorangium sp. So ce1097]|uniref:hypothetical protein n=1 Tax=Sorangium sp. So ce1097 TaxID=3133330 RepID=UPI003F6334C1
MIRRTVCLALSTLSLTAGLAVAASASGAPLAPPVPLMQFGNKLDLEKLGFNLLTTNRLSLTALIHNPLSTESFGAGAVLQGVVPGTGQRIAPGTGQRIAPGTGQRIAPGTLHNALLDPAAREVMGYLVACALGGQQSVSWTPAPGESWNQASSETLVDGKLTWRGKVGLCPAWANGAPDAACQELVSACLLASNNAHGRKHDISIRDGSGAIRSTQEELDNFLEREGAFFGNILDPTGLNLAAQKTSADPNARRPDPVDPIYTKAYSCSPPNERELARLECSNAKLHWWRSSRLCAAPDPNGGLRHQGCVATYVGACRAFPSGYEPPPELELKRDVCDPEGTGPSAYSRCAVDGRVWTRPLTVFLHKSEPTGGGQSCKPQPQRDPLRGHGRGPDPGPDPRRDRVGPNAPDDRVRTAPGRPCAPGDRVHPGQAPKAQPR